MLNAIRYRIDSGNGMGRVGAWRRTRLPCNGGSRQAVRGHEAGPTAGGVPGGQAGGRRC